jgi:peptidoglycan/xylan/chitin deacetylase (PgdA/CDA1 family)
MIESFMKSIFLLLTFVFLFQCSSNTAKITKNEKPFNWSYYIKKANFDESKIPEYHLVNPLVMQSGEIVKNPLTWLEKRRPEILRLFENEVYGRVPQGEIKVRFEVLNKKNNVLKGKAALKEVRAWFKYKADSVKMDILIFIPNNGKDKHPLFLGLNFFGNHTVHPDPNISRAKGYVINKKAIGVLNHKASEVKRGVMAYRWPIEKLISHGYGVATIFYGDLDPDFNDGYKNGIHSLFYKNKRETPQKTDWGSISAWAWGLSRAMDYFETDPDIHNGQVVVLGHSRLGKAALWAGAQDTRFAITISNNSGCGGAALFRRKFGETIDVSVAYAPHWYCANFKKYVHNEEALPIDQHLLLSLIAPRPLYVASAKKDAWADPKGEFLALKHAAPVYELFHKKGINEEVMPKLDQPQTAQTGYHIRSGKHDIIAYDWEQYIRFADKHFAHPKKVALTFDDGPDPFYTEKVLDILKKENVKATFFLVGKNVEKYPHVVQRILDEKHLIANHSYSHPHLDRLSDNQAVLRELKSTGEALANITGLPHPYFRPPYGHLTENQKTYLEQMGYKVVMWDIDPKDWNVDRTSANDIIRTVKNQIFDGANILLHTTNASPNRPLKYKNTLKTADALPRLIQYLKKYDYRFVTVDDIR